MSGERKKEAARKEAARKKALGELGELLALKALVDNGYTEISNPNDKQMNAKFADLLATKDGEKYAFSVKTRNKFKKDGKLNGGYRLGEKSSVHAVEISEQHGAIPAWIAVQFDANEFSIFTGTVKELNGKERIPVRHLQAAGPEGDNCLEFNKSHYFDASFFENQKL